MQNIFIEFLPPWVETGLQPAFYDKESGTVLQQTARMYAKINELIASYNKFTEDITDQQVEFEDKIDGIVTEYVGKFEELYTYVHDYFDNLDVQEEINNKLDAMEEAGTLQEIVAEYLNATAVWGFDNVADMKSSTNLINGSFAKTLGYYAKNDGGGATYKIRTVTNDDTVDEMFVIELADAGNQLVAELILDDEVNIKQLGARPQTQSGTKYDIKNYIDRYIAVVNERSQLFTLYIPSGIWHTTGNLLYGKNGLSIKGDGGFTRFDPYADGTVITTYSDNQDYIFRLGDSSHSCHDWNLSGITFSSADFTYSSGAFNFGTPKTVSKALELHHAIFGITDNLFFNTINGKAFTINGCWGNYFKLLNFYKVSNEGSCVVDFETIDSSLGSGAGIIANNFEKIMFERCHGHLISFESNCKTYNNHFGVIRFEPNNYALDGRTYTNFSSEILSTWDDYDCTHYAILNMAEGTKVGENVFDSIETMGLAKSYYTYDSNKYTYDTIILYGNNAIVSNIFTNITSNGAIKDPKVIYIPNTITNVVSSRSFNTFTNFINPDACKFIFDVNGLNDINLPYNVYLKGDRTTTTTTNQIGDYFTMGGWLPAFRAISKRLFLSGGLGFLYYDKDAINNANLVVTPRTDITDVSFLNTVVNTNKTLYIRAKIPADATTKIVVRNRTVDPSETLNANLVGTGDYKIYTISLTNTWNVGDYLLVTHGGTSASDRHISIDTYMSA